MAKQFGFYYTEVPEVEGFVRGGVPTTGNEAQLEVAWFGSQTARNYFMAKYRKDHPEDRAVRPVDSQQFRGEE